MAAVCTCIITSSESNTGAFAVRVDNDENVYIPFSIAEALEIEEFEEIEVILVRNDRENPPWKAIRARRPGE